MGIHTFSKLSGALRPPEVLLFEAAPEGTDQLILKTENLKLKNDASSGRNKGFLDYAVLSQGLIPATSIVATVSQTDRSFQLTSPSAKHPPLAVADRSPRFR